MYNGRRGGAKYFKGIFKEEMLKCNDVNERLQFVWFSVACSRAGFFFVLYFPRSFLCLSKSREGQCECDFLPAARLRPLVWPAADGTTISTCGTAVICRHNKTSVCFTMRFDWFFFCLVKLYSSEFAVLLIAHRIKTRVYIVGDDKIRCDF